MVRSIPLGGDEVLVNNTHLGYIKSDKPHWGSMKRSNTAPNGLYPPSKAIVKTSSLPKNIGSNEPGPDALPEDGRPPLPAHLGLCRLLLGSSVGLGSWNAEAGMELPGNEEHYKCQEELSQHQHVLGFSGIS